MLDYFFFNFLYYLDVYMFGYCKDLDVFFKDILEWLGYVYLGVD